MLGISSIGRPPLSTAAVMWQRDHAHEHHDREPEHHTGAGERRGALQLKRASKREEDGPPQISRRVLCRSCYASPNIVRYRTMLR
jgi:hypothetical protein